ncbi:AraC family transcriptional regulator [soil metagenome]
MSRHVQRALDNQEELVEILAERCRQDGPTPIANGLSFYRYSQPTEPVYGLHTPSICLIAQGTKSIQVGDDVYQYDAADFLLCSMDLPVVTQVVKASAGKPYLGVKLDLDARLITSVIAETEMPVAKTEASLKSLGVSKLTGEVLDAFVRLLRLTGNESEFSALSPLVMRELVYRLLLSQDGARLTQMAIFGGNGHKITKAVNIFKTRLSESISMEDIANELDMSVSSFHQHFKSVTSMSPLQFQKFLRLQEARQILLLEDIDAIEVANRVGYQDPSQFNREYKRRFGEPPKRDALRYKQIAATTK